MIKYESLKKGDEKICVVGLGYVGLPLAFLLDSKYKVMGLDLDKDRVDELLSAYDRTGEIEPEKLKNSQIEFSSDERKISESGFIVVAVPTPVDEYKNPDLGPLKGASLTVGRNIVKGSVVVYESTVFPGATEEVCVPIIEQESGLKWMKDFNVGYSPERVNPGDRNHTIDKIVKVVSGDSPEALKLIEKVYSSTITAGIHCAPDIKTAEAAKVIENTQRDLNISLMNELSIIFHKLGIDTRSVLEAASTKWNFLNFEPGLVGGHCIGVDPYYLTFKAQEIGYHPEVILAGRRINDYMGKYIAEQTFKRMVKAGNRIKGARVLVLGLTFKENVPDLRNTKVVDVIGELKNYGVNVFVYDPLVDKKEALEEYSVELIERVEDHKPYDAIIVALKHSLFSDFTLDYFKDISGDRTILIDVKAMYNREEALSKGIIYWRL